MKAQYITTPRRIAIYDFLHNVKFAIIDKAGTYLAETAKLQYEHVDYNC
jgi:hypothetical protein